MASNISFFYNRVEKDSICPIGILWFKFTTFIFLKQNKIVYSEIIKYKYKVQFFKIWILVFKPFKNFILPRKAYFYSSSLVDLPLFDIKKNTYS